MPKCKEETKMTYFRNTVAVKCGINAAIVAEIIWELQKTEFDKSKTVYHRHRRWCRCSQPMITLICPALSVHMVRDAIKTLAVFMLLALRWAGISGIGVTVSASAFQAEGVASIPTYRTNIRLSLNRESF